MGQIPAAPWRCWDLLLALGGAAALDWPLRDLWAAHIYCSSKIYVYVHVTFAWGMNQLKFLSKS